MCAWRSLARSTCMITHSLECTLAHVTSCVNRVDCKLRWCVVCMTFSHIHCTQSYARALPDIRVHLVVLQAKTPTKAPVDPVLFLRYIRNPWRPDGLTKYTFDEWVKVSPCSHCRWHLGSP